MRDIPLLGRGRAYTPALLLVLLRKQGQSIQTSPTVTHKERPAPRGSATTSPPQRKRVGESLARVEPSCVNNCPCASTTVYSGLSAELTSNELGESLNNCPYASTTVWR